ncbi:MAG: methylmalonyl Co-A mutase-associated GTPase MeaB, partial [Kordiimonadaceae bacterium]|nr:methylmalonyl Co-A mutase-associated GTPase MeaB [Kordiimonadaceae bacterium]
SEVAVSDLVDMFLLLLSPGGGDELQGIKRGIMEIADLVVVNKADGDFINAARIAASDCENALHLMQPKSKNWTVNVLQASALNNIGLEEVWQNIQSYKATMLEHGEFESRRDQQNIAAVWSEVNEIMIDHLKQQKFDKIDAVERAVKNKKITASAAARELLSSVLD